MSLIKWSPVFDSFEDMDKAFNDFMPMARSGNNPFMPAIDMYEDKNNVIIETQLAGINPEQVSISIENDTLIIKGESEKKSEVEDKNYYRKEIKRGSFYRSIQLPAHVAGDEAIATADDGVLKISIPKKNDEGKKTIKIQTSKKSK
jgi:HSP20 family protein